MKRRTSYLVVSLVCALALAFTSGCSGHLSTKPSEKSTSASVETSSTTSASATAPDAAPQNPSTSQPDADASSAPKASASDKATSKQTTPDKKTPSKASTTKTQTTTRSTSAKTVSPTKSTSPQQNTSSSTSGSTAPSKESQKITVTVSVDCKTAVAAGYEQATSISSSGSLAQKTVTLPKGASAFDALKASGLSVGSESTSMGTYVYSIASLREKQCGSMSGWLYMVNGKILSKSCDSAILQSGDRVNWRYTCNGGKDL